MKVTDSIALSITRWDGYILLASLTLLNIADFLITQQLVFLYGYKAEANPVMYQLLVLTDNVYSILWFKGIILSGLVGLYIYLTKAPQHRHTRNHFEWMVRGLNLIYVGVVVWSLHVYTNSGGKMPWA